MNLALGRATLEETEERSFTLYHLLWDSFAIYVSGEQCRPAVSNHKELRQLFRRHFLRCRSGQSQVQTVARDKSNYGTYL
jgi:hypothetical protein